MSAWTTTATIYPAYSSHFPPDAKPATLQVETSGSVLLQRQDAAGSWETFETVTDPTRIIDVANLPAIKVTPVSSAAFRFIWTD